MTVENGSRADEDRWVEAAKDGERGAFDRLIESHGRAVLRYAEGLAGRSIDAEDLAQEALLQAFNGLATFKTGTDFRAWLLTITYHAWTHGLRRKKVVMHVDPEKLENLAARDTRTREAGGDDELARDLNRHIQNLPDEQRAVVLLRFGQGLSHARIAEITGAEVATVRWRLYRARQTLQRGLAKWNAKKGPES